MVVLNFEKSQITFFRMINGQSANTKKPRYSQKFIQQYESIPEITKSSRGDEFAFCKYCKKDISIAHSGMYDIERHRGTNVHKDILAAFMPCLVGWICLNNDMSFNQFNLPNHCHNATLAWVHLKYDNPLTHWPLGDLIEILVK